MGGRNEIKVTTANAYSRNNSTNAPTKLHFLNGEETAALCGFEHAFAEFQGAEKVSLFNDRSIYLHSTNSTYTANMVCQKCFKILHNENANPVNKL